MTLRSPLLALALGCSLLAVPAGAGLRLSAEAAQALTEVPADPGDLALTIYSGDLALVADKRRAGLNEGKNLVTFPGVSPKLRPETALTIAEAAEPVRLIEQRFDFDVLSPEALLENAVGSEVRVVRTIEETGEEIVEEAIVLSTQNGVVLRIGDRIETGVPGRIVYDSLPVGVRTKPALLATLDSAKTQAATVRLRYLTRGLTWRADYVAELGAEQSTLSLFSFATITNTSGTDYDNAEVRLAAGTVNREEQPVFAQRPMMQAEARALAADAAPPEPERESVAQVHVYTLPERTTIGDKETKQVTLLDAATVPVEREYRLRGNVAFHPLGDGNRQRVHPEVLITFKNDDGAGLGKPLPAGTVRVYGQTKSGEAVFVGSDSLRHTARGEKVELTLGRAFDVTADRVQTDFRRTGLPKNTLESAYAIELRNVTDKAVNVEIIEGLGGDWEILEESQERHETLGNTVSWIVSVPAEGSSTLSYRVRIKR